MNGADSAVRFASLRFGSLRFASVCSVNGVLHKHACVQRDSQKDGRTDRHAVRCFHVSFDDK